MNIKFKPTNQDLANAALFRGCYTAVARRLKVSPQHVRHVALGISTSKRVSAALGREIRRRRLLEAEAA